MVCVAIFFVCAALNAVAVSCCPRSLASVCVVVVPLKRAAGGLRGSAKVQAGQVYFGEATDGQGAWLDVASTLAASEHAFGPCTSGAVRWLFGLAASWPAWLPVVAALRQLRSSCLAWHVCVLRHCLLRTIAFLDLLHPCGTTHTLDFLQCSMVVCDGSVWWALACCASLVLVHRPRAMSGNV